MPDGESYAVIQDLQKSLDDLRTSRDHWRLVCVRLTNMLMTYAPLMNRDERKDLNDILEQAVRGD